MNACDYRPIEDVAGGNWVAHPRNLPGVRGCRVHGTGVFVRAGQEYNNVIVRDGRGQPVAIARLTFSKTGFGTVDTRPVEAHSDSGFYRIAGDGTLTQW